MDLIPVPLDALPGIDVPLVDIVPYDFQGFSTFASRHGFEWHKLLRSSNDPGPTASLLQSWLFFAFLAEFFGNPVELADFANSIRGSHAYSLLCSKPLNGLMSGKEPAKTEQKTLLRQVNELLQEVEDSPYYLEMVSPVVEIGLSIRILLQILGDYVDQPFIDWSIHPLVSKLMLDRHWCPSQVKQVELLQNNVIAYYLMRLRRPEARNFDHGSCPESHCEARNVKRSLDTRHTHSDKDNSHCSFISVNVEAMKKIIEQGDIPLVSIQQSPQEVVQLHVRAAAATDRYIALSHVWSDGLGNAYANALPICQLQRLASYIENLPHPSARPSPGQIRSLFSFGTVSIDLMRSSLVLRKKSRSTLFWMDTLCIPVGSDERSVDLKNRAINHMAFIYGKASQVLVLDSAMQSLHIRGIQKSELLAQLNFCGWKGRCWTYQEGSLTPHCHFQCRDGAINPLESFSEDLGQEASTNDVLHKITLQSLRHEKLPVQWVQNALHRQSKTRSMVPTPLCERRIAKMLYSAMYLLFASSMHVSGYHDMSALHVEPLRTDDIEWIQHLVGVWNALAKRSTTKREDVPAIVANLLGFHSYQIMTLPADQRLRKMLCSADVLPVSLLYNPGPRMNPEKGHLNRWVPIALGTVLLQELPLMFFDDKKNLILDSSRMSASSIPQLVFIDFSIPLDVIEFFIQGPSNQWIIKCVRGIEDRMDVTMHGAACLILCPEYRRGALLRVEKDETRAQSICFNAIYDCPVVMKSMDPSSVDLSIYPCTWLTGVPWRLKLLNDSKDWGEPAPRISRANNKAFLGPRESVTWAFRFFSILTPLVLLILTATILRIYIAANIPWTDLSAVGRASLITFVIQRIPSPMVFLPVTQILFLIDRRRDNNVKSIDIAYVIIDCIWIAYCVAMVPVIIHQWIRYRFEAQLATWREDRIEGRNIEGFWLEVRPKLPIWAVRWVEWTAGYEVRDLGGL